MNRTGKILVFIGAVFMALAIGLIHHTNVLKQELFEAKHKITLLENELTLATPAEAEDNILGDDTGPVRFQQAVGPIVVGPNVPQPPPSNFKHEVERNGTDTIITYGNFNGRPLQMVLNRQSRRIILRIDMTASKLETSNVHPDTATLDFLRHEVERLVSFTNVTTELGNSGVTFKFHGNLPAWGPHSEYLGFQKHYECLYFGNDAKVQGRNLEAWGEKTKPGYYPYQLAVTP